MSDRRNEFSTIRKVFTLLDKWRHLPGYALERRVDVFFALFLPEVLEKHYGIKVKCPLIPEFPIGKNKNDNRHRQVDYLALSEDGRRALLIELKTDMASKRSTAGKKQEKLLLCSCQRGLKDLVEDVIVLAKHRDVDKRNKYTHLLYYLKELELVCFDDQPHNLDPRSDQIELASCIDKPELEALYIQPDEYKKNIDNTDVVDFKTFAGAVRGGPGRKEVRELFANCLLTWERNEAGSCPPDLTGKQ